VNLFWAIDRMKRTFQKAKAEGKSVTEIQQILLDDAKGYPYEDIESQRLIAKFGGELLETIPLCSLTATPELLRRAECGEPRSV
jgi:methylthioribose-1-phosphate isomerase